MDNQREIRHAEAKSQSPHVYFVGEFVDNRDEFWYADPGTKVIYLEEGSQVIHTPSGALEVGAKMFAVIPDGMAHRFESFGTYRSHVVRFSSGYLGWDDRLRVFSCPAEEGATFLGIKSLLGILFYSVLQVEKSPHVIATLTLLVEWLKSVENRDERSLPIPRGVMAARRLIEDKVTHPLTLEEIAKNVHLSASYLRTSFTRHMGCAPLHYQQELRMERARRLLLLPWMSIEQVARNCGYADPHYFARLFRKYYNVSPSQWRKSHPQDIAGLEEEELLP